MTSSGNYLRLPTSNRTINEFNDIDCTPSLLDTDGNVTAFSNPSTNRTTYDCTFKRGFMPMTVRKRSEASLNWFLWYSKYADL